MASQTNIKVVCRFRPQNSLELREGGEIAVSFDDNLATVFPRSTAGLSGPEKDGFTFDKVFPMGTQQAEVFDYGVKGIVKDVLDGYNGTVFAYGQTGSGKTFTMMGADIDNAELKGIIPRITEQIFTSIVESDASLEYVVKVSYMEIYLERIRDLMAPQQDNLQIHEEKSKGVYVKGLSDYYVGNAGEVYEIMRQGGLARVVTSTNMNAESSRSHSIFLITVQQRNTESGAMKSGNLYLVDLAGSEKVGKTGASGTTLEEAKKINKSLSALGMVINALTDGKSSHIPYRDSKLTRILQESLGGNSRTTLIINCSPSSYNEPETLSTLRFGMRAKSIKNSARVNAELSPTELKGLLKKAQASNTSQLAYIAALEAEVAIWRAGGKVDAANYASVDGKGGIPTTPVQQAKKAPSSRSMTPSIPALEALKDLESRPQTPTAIGLDKDERDEFLKRENELIDQLGEKESQLAAQGKILAEVREELAFIKEQESGISTENKTMSTQLNDLRLQVERLGYDNKESIITIDILKEQNQDLTIELEDLRHNIADLKTTTKDAAAADDKERKKAEKMAIMMAKFDTQGAFSDEKEESLRATMAKLDSIDSDTGISSLTADDVILLRRQLVESQTSLRDTLERLRQSQEEKDMVHRRKEEVEERLSGLETEYEELLEKTIDEEEVNHEDVADIVSDLKTKLEAQYTAKREAHEREAQDLKAQLEAKGGEIRTLHSNLESMKGVNEELKRAFAVTSAGIEGGKNLAESAKDLERTRKAITVQLAEFDGVKKSLMRDLQNRCEKVVELEIQLDELKELYNNVIRNSNSKAQQKKMAFLERNLEQLTLVQKQLVDQNTALKKEAGIAERKLLARNERIQNLEVLLQDADRRLAIQNTKFEQQLNAVRERLDQARAQKQQSNNTGVGFGRIAKPLRGGGGAAIATGAAGPAPPTTPSQPSYSGTGLASPFARLQAEESSASAKHPSIPKPTYPTLLLSYSTISTMTSAGDPTSRKPSGSSTHSGVHSSSPSSRAAGRRNAPSSIYTGLTTGATYQNQGPGGQRYDSASSPSRSSFTEQSPYSGQSGGLPLKPVSHAGSTNGGQRSVPDDLGLGIQGLGTPDNNYPMGGNHYGQGPGPSYKQGAVIQNAMPMPTGMGHVQQYPRPEYFGYYGSPTTERFTEYHAFSPTMFAMPQLPSVSPYEYNSTHPTPTAGPPDALRSPTGGYFPGNGPPSQFQGSTYYYPTPSQAFMLSAAPQSPYATSHFPAVVTSSDLDSKKRQLQNLQYSVQQQHQQLSHQQQSLMMAMQQIPPQSPMSPTYPSSFPRYPSGMPVPQSTRSSGYWPTAPIPASTSGGKRLSGSFKGLLTPKSTRRSAVDTESSVDSGVGLRSALLEQFRSDKSGNWQLRDVVGKIVEFSGDQHGSRFIQERIQTAKPEEKQQVFDEIVPDHALHLMGDVFGNYVIQKLFEHGTPAQKDAMVDVMTGHMLSLTLQMYGCRVVQKLHVSDAQAIENITPEQQTLLVSELEHHVLDCVKDANGNHVIQKIIQCVPGCRVSLVESFRGNVAFMASHPYGCRVLQRCLEWMQLEQTRPLLDELHASTTALMQDGFGNYVIQFVLERGGPEDRSNIVHKLLGHVLSMARHKFASNVVEKAILTAEIADRRVLIDEILASRSDGQLTILIMMKDQYANYVLQRALAAADRDQLIELCARIRPQLVSLRRYSSTFTKHLSAIEKLMNQRLPLQPLSPPSSETEVRRHSFHEYRGAPPVEGKSSQ
ncbi:hypothetical protein FRB96_000627 [Tulasnella sp. 330]|nr:hypothetical protein FRB96_000627 [Tulasnella sp. 330]